MPSALLVRRNGARTRPVALAAEQPARLLQDRVTGRIDADLGGHAAGEVRRLVAQVRRVGGRGLEDGPRDVVSCLPGARRPAFERAVVRFEDRLVRVGLRGLARRVLRVPRGSELRAYWPGSMIEMRTPKRAMTGARPSMSPSTANLEALYAC